MSFFIFKLKFNTTNFLLQIKPYPYEYKDKKDNQKAIPLIFITPYFNTSSRTIYQENFIY